MERVERPPPRSWVDWNERVAKRSRTNRAGGERIRELFCIALKRCEVSVGMHVCRREKEEGNIVKRKRGGPVGRRGEYWKGGGTRAPALDKLYYRPLFYLCGRRIIILTTHRCDKITRPNAETDCRACSSFTVHPYATRYADPDYDISFARERFRENLQDPLDIEISGSESYFSNVSARITLRRILKRVYSLVERGSISCFRQLV